MVCDDGGFRVWQSHILTGDVDAVRVDVWHGRFIEAGLGWSVLPGGSYRAVLARDSQAQPLEEFAVEEQELFRGDFTRPQAQWFGDYPDWHADGTWRCEKDGISPVDQTVYVFADGEIHGSVAAAFQANECEQGRTWGLITQHYNASYHLRMVFDGQTARLIWVTPSGNAACSHNLLVEAACPLAAGDEVQVVWQTNGTAHLLLVNGRQILAAQAPAAGGVTVVGLFADPHTTTWRTFRMTTSQAVPKYLIEKDQYQALVRPGNIQKMRLKQSAAPNLTFFWESGLQHGHIGGSELKYTQGADLHMVSKGPVADVIDWRGPMPKSGEQSDDVRGWARGTAYFYPQRIVLADYVLTLVCRSDGPDFDLLGRVVNGHARLALGNTRTFMEWALSPQGTFNHLGQQTCGQAYPLAVVFPLDLGGQQWFLKAVIGSLLNVDGDHPAGIFAWRCPRGLTASHDFRAGPTIPGREYGFSIVTEWQRGDDIAAAQADTLNLRDDWYQPMAVETEVGTALVYDMNREQPAEVIGFDGCFDRNTGTYVLIPQDGRVKVKLDPRGIRRRMTAFCLRGVREGAAMRCTIDGQALRPGDEFLEQPFGRDRRLVLLPQPIEQPITVEITLER